MCLVPDCFPIVLQAKSMKKKIVMVVELMRSSVHLPVARRKIPLALYLDALQGARGWSSRKQ